MSLAYNAEAQRWARHVGCPVWRKATFYRETVTDPDCDLRMSVEVYAGGERIWKKGRMPYAKSMTGTLFPATGATR